MAKPLDFRKIKKPTWTIILDDGKDTPLLVNMPTKSTWETIIELQDNLSSNGESTREDMDALYEACAEIMSNNKGGITVTVEDLESCLDFVDIITLFEGYIAFVQEVIDSKN